MYDFRPEPYFLGEHDGKQYYGKWISYVDEEERLEGQAYLKSWKKFDFRHRKDLKLIDEVCIEHKDIPEVPGIIYRYKPMNTLALKLVFEITKE
jgi:hypothetical protein